MTSELISPKENGKSLEQTRTKTVTDSLSTHELISWDELLLKPKNGFIQNNAIVIEVEIKSKQPDPGNWAENPMQGGNYFGKFAPRLFTDVSFFILSIPQHSLMINLFYLNSQSELKSKTSKIHDIGILSRGTTTKTSALVHS